ncbi:hypothetical protein [Nocardioides zhouii]|uniref:ABC transporter permease n=1 Tax=Nocardioides zhouii TaxID=1168729 RepID=A0A4Q2T4J9_9ACTN|nr:hypothetical protein [Nocardioides zhouii]RYC13715.1 hypothetical protein EUA94_03680 [Nocardioides zhouii]
MSMERRFSAALAEFDALRAEILNLRQTQKNIVSIALAAYAGLFSFALGGDGDARLLTVVPPLGLVLCILQLSESFQIDRIGSYLRTTVWPEVMALSDYAHSWEEQHGKRSWLSRSAGAVLLDGTLPVLLFGAGVAAIILGPDLSGTSLALEWVCVALTLLAPALYGLIFLAQRGRPESNGQEK